MDDFPTNPSRRSFLTGRLDRPPLGDPATETASRIAAVGSGCLPLRGVDCQICRDVCPAEAIRFRPRRGGPFLPDIRAAACTGCGDCGRACPTGAIVLTPPLEDLHG